VPFAGLRARTKDWLHHRLDDTVLRWLLRGMIAITAAGLVLDYTQRQTQEQERTASLPPVTVPEAEPDISRTAITELLPSVRREHKPLLQRGDDRLKSAMSFDLLGDGRLIANGAIP
jgi:hypothetical protein